MLDPVALVGHRPRRRLETRECGDERGEVDARPVALDQEGRERGWIARSVHAADDARRAPPDERGDYPDQSVVGAFGSAAIKAPSSAREWMPSFS